MLVFRTVIPLNPVKDIQELVDISIKWISGSRHYKLNGTLLAHMGQRDFIEQIENEKFECFSYAENNTEFACTFFENYECDKKWRSEVVFKKSESETLFSISIYCETRDFGNFLNNVRKPYIIKLLDEEIGFSADGHFPTGGKAHIFNAEELDMAADIINGNFKTYLPCLYISMNRDGSYYTNTETLSKLLSGVAHVFLEPNVYFSNDLRTLTDDKNPYMGAVGIFFPENGIRKYIIPSPEYNYAISSKLAFTRIKNAMIFGSLRDDLSYSTIKMRSIQNKLINSERCSAELYAYMEEIDRELIEENKRLKDQITQLQCQQNTDTEPVRPTREYIKCGSHPESYSGQITDTILDVLEAHKESLIAGTRSRAILDAILTHTQRSGKKEEIVGKLKNIFKGFRSLNGNIESRLTELDFVVDRTKGNHPKLYFRNFPQIYCTLSTSGSDSRSGKNLISDIKRHLL